jgi:hypothetical protein
VCWVSSECVGFRVSVLGFEAQPNLQILGAGEQDRSLVHGLECGYSGGRLTAEVAENPIFEYCVDENGEGGNEEGIEGVIFGNA